MLRYELSFLCFCLLAVSSVHGDDAKTFTGDWEVAGAIIEGNEVPVDFNKMMQIKMRGNRYMTSRTGELVDEGTFALQPKESPARIVITGVKGENAGKNFRGIYRLDGEDKLTICYALDGKAFPEKFDGKPPGMVLITYSRRKTK